MSQSEEVRMALLMMRRNGLDYFVSTAGRGEIEAIKAMIEAGANVNHIDPLGRTALHASTQQGHAEVVRVLLENGADPNVRRRDGRTPLESAESLGYVDIAELLREKGAKE
jgi:ankyrin repeat protein